MPKSCLKIPTPPMTPGGDGSHPRKCVAFSAEDLERIYIADEWDRTPTEVAHKLSYGDVLELKAIQRSLPTAPQLPDPLARRPQSQYLKGVPIALLPLYDDSLPCNSVSKPARATSPFDLPPVPSRSPSFSSTTPNSFSSTPISTSSPKPTSPYPTRPKPNFAFLPLLDTPSPPPPPPPSSEVDTDDSDHDLSTPALSTASLDTTPSPLDHPDLKSNSYFQLPPRKAAPSSYPYLPLKAPSTANPALCGPSSFSLIPPNPSANSKNVGGKKPPQKHTESLRLDINGETYHFGPMSTPPDSPSSSSLSPTLQSSPKLSSPQRSAPLFSFDQDRGQDLPPSLSRSGSRNQSPQKQLTRGKDFHPPSPILAPFCVSMKRGSPCAGPIPVRGAANGRKGRFEH